MAAKAMERDTKWVIGLIISLLLAVITVGGPAVYYLGSMDSRFEDIEQTNGKLQITLQRLIETDMADVKRRLTIQEQKTILPRAEQLVSDLEQRIRTLETTK